jgi:hypothetical protein
MVAVTIQSDGTDVAGHWPEHIQGAGTKLTSDYHQRSGSVFFSSGDVGGADNAVVVLGMDAS